MTSATLSPAQREARAVAKIRALTAGLPGGSYSVAALNTASGARYVSGATAGMWTASLYKLFVLEALLLRHQQAGTELTSTETAQATGMIENSDNVFGYDLFLDVGGNPGLGAALDQLGLVRTVPGRSDPALTTTGAADCLTLLGNLVAHGPLDAAARQFVLRLMRDVEGDQRWGVGAAADRGTTFANKNGWLAIDDANGPGENDDGLWTVTSAGVLRVHGQQVLMAVLTRHQPSFEMGVDLVQGLAEAAAAIVSP